MAYSFYFFGLLPTGSGRQRGEGRGRIAGCEEVFKLLAGVQRSPFSAVYIAGHGEREVSIPGDVLQGLGIYASFVKHSEIAMPEYMCGGVMEVNTLADRAEHVLVLSQADGHAFAANDEAFSAQRSEKVDQLTVERQCTI